MSAVNWSEVLHKTRVHGLDADEAGDRLELWGVDVVPATRGDAALAARFWARATPLSLGDRFCLALAFRLGARAVTTERSWAGLDTGAEILVIR